MARRRRSSTITTSFKGIIVSLYRNARSTWEASFTIPGRTRDKAYGATEAECRKNACDKIRGQMGAEKYADRSDEEAARRILKDHGISLAESARFWVAQHSMPLRSATVAEIRASWLDRGTGTNGKRGYHHFRALESRSKHILEKFGNRQIASITQEELRLWQDEVEQEFAPRGARNIHDACKVLWRYARKRSFLDPERLSAMEMLDRPTAKRASKHTYTPDEMQTLLDTAWAHALPGAIPMVATAFGSLRAEELCCQNPEAPLALRLAWEDINWKEKFIWVPEEVDKNGEGRRAGLPKNLLEMLRPRRGKGPLFPGTRLDLAYQEIAKKAGIKWKHNALRHSCLTYQMLLAHNATAVANMAGNSVTIIEARYRNKRATKAEAKKWFNLKPRVAWSSALRAKALNNEKPRFASKAETF